MKKLWIWIISFVVLLVIFFAAYLFIPSTQTDPRPLMPAECYSSPLMVERVIDGDTFLLCSGDTVRLLCVDTPEKGEEGYEEAKLFLEDLILYKEVSLVTSDYNVNTDKYDRLLRWVYLANESSQTGEWIFINKLLLEENYGDLLVIPPETCNLVEN